MSKIIFDIETAGEDFDQMDAVTQKVLTRWIREEAKNETEAQKELAQLKDRLVFSPLTAQVVAIGMVFLETRKDDTSIISGERRVVYFSAPTGGDDAKQSVEAFEESGVEYKPMGEKEMLENFWKVAAYAEEFITFNGRGFDVPFLMIRSAVHGLRPTKDLLSNRYLSSQRFGAKHIDLMDQLTFYGASWRRPNLHLACRALGIKSPKEDGIAGDDVTKLYREGKYLDIARYNARDILATKELYEKWNRLLRF